MLFRFSFLLFSFVFALNINAQASEALEALVNDYVSAYLENDENFALSIGIHDGAHTYEYYFGQVSNTDRRKPDAYDLYEIGSVTKLYSSAILLELAKEHKIHLDSSICFYLADTICQRNTYLENIKVRHLSTHSSSLPRKALNFNLRLKDRDNPYLYYTKADLTAYLIRHKNPDKKYAIGNFRYSNLGFGLLGLILENASEQSYDELLHKYISTPLALDNSFAKDSLAKWNNIMIGHDYDGQEKPYWHFSTHEASSGIKSSLSDAIKFMHCAIDSSALSINESIRRSCEPILTTNLKKVYIGHAWHIIDRGKRYPKVYTHSGATGGHRTYFSMIKESQTFVVLMANSVNNLDYLGIQLLELLNR